MHALQERIVGGVGPSFYVSTSLRQIERSRTAGAYTDTLCGSPADDAYRAEVMPL